MKENIKQILREGAEVNSLGVLVTRPDQKLVIMRGVSGGGKSTKAKKLVGEGVIHSTDDLVAATGDYKGFWKLILENNDYSSLHRLHVKNLSNAKESMLKGISPVVIDNTCLRIREMSGYIKDALQLGYCDDNIQIVDVDTDLSAEELAERNTHGVSLDKIKKMIQTKKSVGVITLEMVIEHINRKGC